jgi:hypothetical protein
VVALLVPPPAQAQSTIAGEVKDPSGAVVPGATVEASSPALIERLRTVTTDGEGRYAIFDVRPGTYRVTFRHAGFAAHQQEGIEVPAGTTVSVNAELEMGMGAEAVTVHSEVPVVDIQNSAHPVVLTRKLMDSIPSARNLQSLGSLVPGVHLTTPDVGGSQQIEQVYMATHGNPPVNDSVMIDGLLVNGMLLNGMVQNYIDNAALEEASYQTSGVSAAVSGGGVFANLVPKDGGDRFHGQLFLGGSSGSWQSNNLDAALQARGVTGVNAVDKIEDFDGSIGGPVVKGKLWFLVAGRKQVTFTESYQSKYPDGRPGVEDAWIWSGTARLTYEVNTRNKISAMYMRNWKTKGHEIFLGGQIGIPDNPAVSSTRRDPVMLYIAQAKWTSTVTPRLVFQTGYSIDKQDSTNLYQPGVNQSPFTPAWYGGASHYDPVQNLRSNAGIDNQYYYSTRNFLSASAAYITGSHQIKTGGQWSWGRNYQNNTMNGDLWQVYLGGVPAFVYAFNTPVYSRPYLNADLGIYTQDTWTHKRWSITAGVRFEYLRSEIRPESAPAGRFVPARAVPRIDCTVVRGLGCWKTWSPRVGVVYDLFGNGETAAKASFARYNTPLATDFLSAFNPMTFSPLIHANLPWVDLNRDGIAQDREINLGNLPPNFGTVTNIPKLDPHFAREYNLQYSMGLEHQVHQRVALKFNWYRRTDYDQALLVNRAVDPTADWTPTTITNPVDGTPIKVYNLNANAVGRTPDLYQTNSPQNQRRETYTGFETLLSAFRMPHGVHVLAGWTIEHLTSITCDATSNALALNDPNSLRYCDWSGSSHQDLGKNIAVPWRNEFKLMGTVPIKWGVEASASLYSSPAFGATPGVGFTGFEGFKTVSWTVSPATVYPANCVGCTPGTRVDPGLNQGSETITLVAPGSRLTPRLNQLDVGIRKSFRFRERFTLVGEAQVFNMTNSNAPLVESFALGTDAAPFLAPSACGGSAAANCGTGGTVSSFQNPRLLRLSMQLKF